MRVLVKVTAKLFKLKTRSAPGNGTGTNIGANGTNINTNISDVEVMNVDLAPSEGVPMGRCRRPSDRDEAIGEVGDIRYPDGEIDPLLLVKRENCEHPSPPAQGM